MTGTMISSRAESRTVASPSYNVSLGYLRAFITVLVVAHHAVLAYHPYAPPPAGSLNAQPWWRAFPVLDSQRSTLFALLVAFNDVFFMSLMFFLSGLFVWKSLRRKGAGSFVRDRVLRLGLPFVFAAAVLAPLAYYPAYLQVSARPSVMEFWRQWLSLGDWPAGPAWFVWVLLAFGCVAALSYRIAPTWAPRLGERLSSISASPARFFLFLVAVTAAVYIPMAVIFNSLRWTAVGPFTFQTSRIFHYLAYFLIATALGAWGIDRGLLERGGKLARRWPVWTLGALIAFASVIVITVIAISAKGGSPALTFIGSFAFVVSCATSSLMFLAIFVRFAGSSVAVFDSLRDNAYGIYLLHYAFVSWLQYRMLGVALPALVKGSAVFVAALLLSWGTAAAIRRIPGVGKVI
ncbi:MAG TPA: acyltransferase [Bryobacteraceae bacterium]|nr:acyltransferase [Bryobacteraceae bacterium]